MNIRLVVSSLLVAAVCCVVTAQEFRASRVALEIAPSTVVQNSTGTPLPAGTYSIGTGGYFPTIDSAFRKLSADGIAGGVTLELIDTLYIAPADTFGFRLQGPIAGAGPDSRIVIKPATGRNVVVEGNWHFVLSFWNTSYVTLDGVGSTGATTLMVHSLTNPQYSFNRGVGFMDNSDHNIVQHIVFIGENFGTNYGLVLATPSGTGTPDYNIVQDNFFRRGNTAIVLGAINTSAYVVGNVIRNNTIGSATDTLIAWGIQLEHAQRTIVENNIVQHLTGPSWDMLHTIGINSYWGYENTIRNNIVHGIHANAGSASSGILLSGDTGYRGFGDSVYNNMVYDVQNTSTASASRASGIQMWYQDNPKVYFNTVSLTGKGNGANLLGSAALYVRSSCTGVDAKNNILVNTRDESPYCASAIYDYSLSNLTADYNDLCSGSSQTSALVRIGSTTYGDLTGWRGQGKDLHSVSVMPPFKSTTNLHIDTLNTWPQYTPLRNAGVAVAGCERDIDGDSRTTDNIPDIGADEFWPTTTGVADETSGVPSDYFLAQNYPNPFNPSTTLSFELSVLSFVDLRVFDLLGREVAVLVNEEKMPGTYTVTWNARLRSSNSGGQASGMASGIYFYTLRAGGNVSTKRMILLR